MSKKAIKGYSVLGIINIYCYYYLYQTANILNRIQSAFGIFVAHLNVCTIKCQNLIFTIFSNSSFVKTKYRVGMLCHGIM